MVRAVGDESQGWSYLVHGLHPPLIGLIYRWGLNSLSALAGSLFLPLILTRLTRTIVEPICFPLSWRL